MTGQAETMRGVWLTGHGDLDKLEPRSDLPVPRPGHGEVLVRVGAAGVNNTDINMRTAWYSKSGTSEDAGWDGTAYTFPRIQGIDVCGRIVTVGEGVDADRVGERVLIEPCLREAHGCRLDHPWYLGSEVDGGFAEYTAVAARHAYRVDSPLCDVELASFPCSYSTAENLLTRARVEPRDRVLVTGASGGVGSAAIQLARARGARVIAVTSAAKRDAVADLGPDRIVDRAQGPLEALGADSVDVVVDVVGGPGWPTLLDVLRPGGRYAASGAVAGPIVELDLRTLYLKDLSLFGGTALDEGVFANLVALIERGAIKPLVAQTFPLERIADAQRAFLEKQYAGKIVLEIEQGGATDRGWRSVP